MAKGGVCGEGVCMVKGGVHGEGGVCGKKGWACVVCTPPFYEIWLVNVQSVRILLECILVKSSIILV